MIKYNHAFIVSRFQPFHNGHKSLVDKMLNESKYCTIVIGSAQESRTDKNPFSCEERMTMLKNIYKDRKNLVIFCLDNIPDDNMWYNHVMKNVSEKSASFGYPEAFYCGGLYEASWFDKGKLKIEILDKTKQNNKLKISGTEIRNMIKNNNKNWEKFVPVENLKFLKNIIKKSILYK